MNENIINILKKFNISEDIISYEPFGEGHINNTFLCKTNSCEYVLQKINHFVFKDVKRLMENVYNVTEYIKKEIIKQNGNPDRETLSIIQTKSKENYYYDGTSYYRVYLYIKDSISYQNANKELFYQSAKAIGNFAKLLKDFDASTLYESIPNFHNTIVRYNNFMHSVSIDIENRKDKVLDEIEFVKKRKDFASKIVDALDKKIIPLKVTHNDTKLNNILFDKDTNLPLSLIDFDTIMPGTICYDFGDSIRFGCNDAKEDETNLDKVTFNLDLFESFTKGYFESLKDSITYEEALYLSTGALMMTYECGMRFLTDYLDGDVYFNIQRTNHNLDRARCQFKLLTEMENNIDKMNDIVMKYYNLYK